MQQSEKIDQLLKALFAAQAELEHADKSSNNPHFKSKYADLPTVLDTAKPVLQKHGLGVMHFRNCSYDGGDGSGVSIREYLVTRLFHAESGQWQDSVALLNPVKNDPQGVGSAITYARRYDYQAILGMASEDDDGNAASGNASPPTKKARTSKYGERNDLWEEIKAEILGCQSLPELRAVWSKRFAEVESFRGELYDNLVRYKDEMKLALEAGEAMVASHGHGFAETR